MGRAIINSLPVAHRLVDHRAARGTRTAADVGRSQTGELIWIWVPSTEPYPPALIAPEAPLPKLSSLIAELRETQTASSELQLDSAVPSERRRLFEYHTRDGVRRWWKKWRTKIFFGGGIAATLIVLVLFFTPGSMAPATGLIAASVPATATPQAEQSVNVVALDPEAFAKQAVLAGKVNGLEDLGDTPPSQITAHVLSRNGSFVLLELTVVVKEGLTKFATVLLQGAESGWRIRQVFDVN